MEQFTTDYEGVRSTAVTSKGKEQTGCDPSIYYEPAAVVAISDDEAATVLERLMESGEFDALIDTATQSQVGRSLVILPPQTLVFVKPHNKSLERSAFLKLF